MKALSRGYEAWATNDRGLGTAGDVTEEQVAMMEAALGSVGDYDLGKSFLRKIGGAIKKVVKKAAPVAAFIPGGQIFAAAGKALEARDAAKEQKKLEEAAMAEVGPDYLYGAVNNPTVASGMTDDDRLNQLAMLETQATTGQFNLPNFLQSLLQPVGQTAKLLPTMIQKALAQKAQTKSLALQAEAAKALLGFQQKLVGASPTGAVSQAQVQRDAQASSEAQRLLQQIKETERLAAEREARRKDEDKRANGAAALSEQLRKIQANSTYDQIPRLPKPEIPKNGETRPSAEKQPGAMQKLGLGNFAIGGMGLLILGLIVYLIFRKD